MLSTIRIHKGEMLDDGLRKAFPGMNKLPRMAVLAVYNSLNPNDMVHLLVFVAEVCRFDGKDLWKRRMST